MVTRDVPVDFRPSRLHSLPFVVVEIVNGLQHSAFVVGYLLDHLSELDLVLLHADPLCQHSTQRRHEGRTLRACEQTWG